MVRAVQQKNDFVLLRLFPVNLTTLTCLVLFSSLQISSYLWLTALTFHLWQHAAAVMEITKRLIKTLLCLGAEQLKNNFTLKLCFLVASVLASSAEGAGRHIITEALCSTFYHWNGTATHSVFFSSEMIHETCTLQPSDASKGTKMSLLGKMWALTCMLTRQDQFNGSG